MNWGPFLQALLTVAEKLAVTDGIPALQTILNLIATKGPDELLTDAGRQELLAAIKAAGANASADVVQALSALVLAFIQAQMTSKQQAQ